MNIYDFDDTIYSGDSTRDFYFYCLKRFPKILRGVPKMAGAFFLFVCGMRTKTQFKEKMYGFLKYVSDIDTVISDFWDTHQKNIKKWYRNRQRGDDIIISASPEFLLKPVCERIGIKNLIASRVDKRTGIYTGENCHGEEKVRRFIEQYSIEIEQRWLHTTENAGKREKQPFDGFDIDEFYSDSLSDTPLARMAKKAWIIRGEELVKWDKYKTRRNFNG